MLTEDWPSMSSQIDQLETWLRHGLSFSLLIAQQRFFLFLFYFTFLSFFCITRSHIFSFQINPDAFVNKFPAPYNHQNPKMISDTLWKKYGEKIKQRGSIPKMPLLVEKERKEGEGEEEKGGYLECLDERSAKICVEMSNAVVDGLTVGFYNQKSEVFR